MKKVLLFWAALFYMLSGWSQMAAPLAPPTPATMNFDELSDYIKSVALSIAPPDSYSQARALKMHGREHTFWSTRFSNNAPDSISKAGAFNYGLANHIGTGAARCMLGGVSYTGNWKCMGPERSNWGGPTDRNGRITAIWVDPTDTNYILAGSGSGGLWKTTDGGQNWHNLTDAALNIVPGTIAISDIAVNPFNNNIIYLATGSSILPFSNLWFGRYGFGLMYSLDGGASWQIDEVFNTMTGGMIVSPDYVRKLAYMPGTQEMYAIAGKRIFRKLNATTPWAEITPTSLIGAWVDTDPNNDYFFFDFEFTRTSAEAGKVVFSSNCLDKKNYFLIYDTIDDLWEERIVEIPGHKSGIEFHGSNHFGVFDFALIDKDSILFQVNMIQEIREDSVVFQIYKIPFGSGSSLTLTPKLINIDLTRYGGYTERTPNQLLVNEVNPDIVYLLDVTGWSSSIYRSTNGGISFPTLVGNTHADARCGIIYHSSANGLEDIIFCGTDGGAAKKSKHNTMFHSLTGKGLIITQFVSLSSSPDNNKWMTAGSVDNHLQAYNKDNPTGAWNGSDATGDGWKTKFARNGLNISMGRHNSLLTKFSFNSTSNTRASSSQPDDRKKPIHYLNPYQFSADNKMQTGYHYLWDKEIDATVWDLIYINEPKMFPINDPLLFQKQAIDFAISERNADVGYIVYANPAWTSTTTDTTGKLWSTIDGGDSWDNISPSPVQYFPITDIEIDQQQPNRIWVAFGGFDWEQRNVTVSLRERRIFYSNNNGETWQDVSKGLPPLPVHKVVLVPGSDDVLFAGTDAGVYRWNKAKAQWDCFNTGMPLNFVLDMEVLHCSGKLRIATYGRGIWETDISDDMPNYIPGVNYSINSNTVWGQSKTVEGSIRVEAGKTLTISGSNTTIYMPRNGHIYVEKGAKLVLDGARITNDCDSCRWAGVMLTGNKTLSPTAANQGTFEMINGAVIENAAIGVSDYNTATLQGGGRILASNSTFLNCWKAVALNDYPNFDRATSATFNNVTFKLTNNKPVEASPSGNPPHQFTAFNERGVKIINSKFRDERGVEVIERATGIYTVDADFTVDQTSFFQLKTGIETQMAYGSATVPRPTIINNTFDQVQENITIYAHNPMIVGNTFSNLRTQNLSGTGVKSPAWAVYLEGTQGAMIYNNQVSGGNSATINTVLNAKKYGVIAKNTGRTGAMYGGNIINNTFTNVQAGLQTEAQNLKLIANCNSFTRNTYPMMINPLTGGTMTGIPLMQAQNGSCSTYRPNNRFVANANGIHSWISSPSYYFDYYITAGANPAFVPLFSVGGLNINTCATLSTYDTNKNCLVTPILIWNSTLHNATMTSYFTEKTADPTSAMTSFYYSEVLRGFNALDNLSGLKSFLINENTDDAKIQLLPMYLSEANYTAVSSTIASLGIDATERNAFQSYYQILMAVKQSNRQLHQLNTQEKTAMQGLASGNTRIADAAKSVLHMAFDMPWVHTPEEPPVLLMNYKKDSEEFAKSALGNPSPNPVKESTQITASITAYDATLHPVLVVYDAMGREKAKYTLKEGAQTITIATQGWSSGIYHISLYINNQVVETKKMSKIN